MLRMQNHKSVLVKPKLANYTIQALMEIQKVAIKLQMTCSNIYIYQIDGPRHKNHSLIYIQKQENIIILPYLKKLFVTQKRLKTF